MQCATRERRSVLRCAHEDAAVPTWKVSHALPEGHRRSVGGLQKEMSWVGPARRMMFVRRGGVLMRLAYSRLPKSAWLTPAAVPNGQYPHGLPRVIDAVIDY